MISWIVRIVMAMAGVITSWFVAREASDFDLLQMVVSLLLIVFLSRLLLSGRIFGRCSGTTLRPSLQVLLEFDLS